MLMRRVFASLLLVLLSCGLALPLLQAQSRPTPACCRRGGKHHCAMSPGADGFRTIAATCPYCPLSALTSPSTAIGVSFAGLSPRLLCSGPPLLQPLQITGCVSDDVRKRGPPPSYLPIHSVMSQA